MAIDTPTVDEFLERFPSFEGKDDLIELLIPEAAGFVSESWKTEDQQPAIMYLVAHFLTMEGPGFATKGQVTSESFGPMSTSYQVSKTQGYETTEFGRRWLVYQRRNSRGGIVVVGGG